jgi:4-diphosphocytidyl-2-C-methyl-D-erythritol kinase
MEAVTRLAPAKINLALDILGERADGYHEMRMVMQTVSLCDTVTLREAGEGFSLDIDGNFFVPAGRKTLEQRAAEAFFQELGRPCPPLCVTLKKRTPAYAGLGGGSADVAALLRLLRERYDPSLPTAVLERVGLTVGSDMPFCVRGGTALAGGRGEVLTDLAPLPACSIVLCKPGFDLPTAELFARCCGTRFRHRPDLGGMVAALAAGSLEGTAERLCNVFEEVLPPEVEREVREIKAEMLRRGALNAAMSGSGPAVFGIFREKEAAAAAVAALKTRYVQTFLTSPVERLDGPVV